MSVYLRAKYQVSSMTLTSFRLGGGTPRTPRKPIQIRVKIRLIFNILSCFRMFVNKHFTCLGRAYVMCCVLWCYVIPLVHCFYVKMKVLQVFRSALLYLYGYSQERHTLKLKSSAYEKYEYGYLGN